MKIRTGFVSNSSSSSFIILLPKDEHMPRSGYPRIEHNTFFDNLEGPVELPEHLDWLSSIPTKADAHGMIKHELEKYPHPRIKSQKALANHLRYAYGVEGMNLGDIVRDFLIEHPAPQTDENGFGDDKFWEETDKHDTMLAEYLAKRVWDEYHKTHHFYALEYSDHNGPLSIYLESGKAFEKIPYIRTSNH